MIQSGVFRQTQSKTMIAGLPKRPACVLMDSERALTEPPTPGMAGGASSRARLHP